jgi:O-antigen/teichoic acid export membrane protein
MIKSSVKGYFKSINERSLKALVNIFFSFLLKGGSIIIQFALVPLTIDYLDKYQYGIWLTLASVLGWFSFFDVGIGNGLRNKLSITLANKDFKLARIYISTSYAFISLIFISLIIIFWFVNPFIDWVRVLNAPAELSNDLSKLTFYIFSFFSLRFIFGLIGNILYADQKPALNNMIGPLGSLFALIIILILKKAVPGSLFWVGIVYGGTPLLVYVIFTFVLFKYKYEKIAPSLKFVQFKYLKDVLGLGMQFFIIQIAALVLFTTSNFLLSQFYGPEEVTAYNIAFRYFTAISMVFGIILTPYWSAITEAYTKKDFAWIQSTMKKLELIAYVFIVISIVMFFVADKVYLLWVGPTVIVPKSVSLMMTLYVIISLLGSTTNTFVNGTGKVRLQLYTAVISIIITIPLAILFCKVWDFGPAGVIAATLCTTFPTMILWRVQYQKIINGNATGIWIK